MQSNAQKIAVTLIAKVGNHFRKQNITGTTDSLYINLGFTTMRSGISPDRAKCKQKVTRFLVTVSTGIPCYSALHLALLPKSMVVQYYVAEFSF
jgi:hypothetical protein